jgi:hypothetical protein
MREKPHCYKTLCRNYHTATVLCGGITTLLFCVTELPHFHTFVCVCGKYHSATALRGKYHTVTVLYKGTTTLLQFCNGNYHIATVLCARTMFLQFCVRELPHCYSSVCGNYLRRLTLLSIIGNILQVNEVCPDDSIIDRVIVTELQLDALTKWREHLCKNQLFIPHRSITVLFDTCLALGEVK